MLLNAACRKSLVKNDLGVLIEISQNTVTFLAHPKLKAELALFRMLVEDEELLNDWMNISIYYKTPTILLDNIAAIIFQKTINLLC